MNMIKKIITYYSIYNMKQKIENINDTIESFINFYKEIIVPPEQEGFDIVLLYFRCLSFLFYFI